MRDYLTLHLDTNLDKGTTCSKKGYGCMDVNEHERLSNITLRHKLK
jgi:hypothetical protein